LPVTSNGDVLCRLPSAAAQISSRSPLVGIGLAFIAVVGITSTSQRSSASA
jgi:hypothetical protein